MPPKVTIITSTYDRMDPLQEAIRCVLAQTYTNWEYFIVSDGYDGRVRKLVKSLGDPRIRYLFTLRTAYAGYLQRTIALRHARGEYVFCLDDDNLIESDYIEKMAGALAARGTGYAICSIRYDGRGIMAPRLPFQHTYIDMLNYMVRTDVACKAGGWVPFDNWSADFLFIERVSRLGKGVFLPEVLGWHRDLSVSAAGQLSSPTHSPSPFRLLTACRDVIIKLGLKARVEKVLGVMGLKFYPDKSMRINGNRMIYQLYRRSWNVAGTGAMIMAPEGSSPSPTDS